MIISFRHKGLEAFFMEGSTKGIDAQLAPKLRRMLGLMHNGPLPDAMRLPGYKLHRLKGDRAGTWSAWVTGGWRLLFDLDGEDAVNVDFENYH